MPLPPAPKQLGLFVSIQTALDGSAKLAERNLILLTSWPPIPLQVTLNKENIGIWGIFALQWQEAAGQLRMDSILAKLLSTTY